MVTSKQTFQFKLWEKSHVPTFLWNILRLAITLRWLLSQDKFKIRSYGKMKKKYFSKTRKLIELYMNSHWIVP